MIQCRTEMCFHQGFEHNPQHSSEAKVRDLCRNPFHLKKKKKLFVTFKDIKKVSIAIWVASFATLNSTTRLLAKTMSMSIIISFLWKGQNNHLFKADHDRNIENIKNLKNIRRRISRPYLTCSHSGCAFLSQLSLVAPKSGLQVLHL